MVYGVIIRIMNVMARQSKYLRSFIMKTDGYTRRQTSGRDTDTKHG